MIRRRLFQQVVEHSRRMAWMTQHDRSPPWLRNLGKSDTLHTDTLHKAKDVVLQDLTPFLPPQTSILGVGRIVEKPVIYRGEFAKRSMIVLSLTFDHRVIDGPQPVRSCKPWPTC